MSKKMLIKIVTYNLVKMTESYGIRKQRYKDTQLKLHTNFVCNICLIEASYLLPINGN